MALTAGMNPRHRELFLKIWAGYQPYHAVTQRLYYLDSHFPPNKIGFALTRLLRHGLKGRAFVDWFAEACGGSDLEMMRVLMSWAENEKKTRALYLAGDLKK